MSANGLNSDLESYMTASRTLLQRSFAIVLQNLCKDVLFPGPHFCHDDTHAHTRKVKTLLADAVAVGKK